MAGLGFVRFRVHRLAFDPHQKRSPCEVWRTACTRVSDWKTPQNRISRPQIRFRGIRIMDWTCGRCTYINSSSGGDSCEVCDAPKEGDEWSCPKCTFRSSGAACKVCGSERHAAAAAGDPDDDLVPAGTSGVSEKNDANAGVDDAQKRKDVEAAEKEVAGLGKQVQEACLDEKIRRKRKADEVDLDVHNQDLTGKRKVDDEVAKQEEEAAPSHSNALLRQLHMERMSRQNSKGAASTASASNGPPPEEVLTFLTYNVWFREDLELEKRMAAIGDIVRQHDPHVMCFQEVTTTIYTIFQRSTWWSSYSCSVSPQLAAKRSYFCVMLSKLPVDRFDRKGYSNSVMGRELCVADLKPGNNTKLVVATTHLESPCPTAPKWDQMFSPERVAQAKEAFSALSDQPNVIFGGDMNWDDKLDGHLPSEDGWFDAWLKLKPNEPGLTYDYKANPMLGSGSRLRKRLDRIFCRLRDFDLQSIEMVGTKAIPGVTYEKEKTVQKQKQMVTLPVLPSDHFGLLLKIVQRRV